MCWRKDSLNEPAASALRKTIVAHIAEHATPDSDLAASAIIISELLANVAKHAPGPVCVDLDWRQDRPVIVVQDSGPGFKPRVELPQVTSEAGRGLYIVSQISGHLTADRAAGDGMRITARLPVEKRHEPPLHWCPLDSPYRSDRFCGWPAVSRAGALSRD